MKVKELFARLDKDDILRAYRLMFGAFSDHEKATRPILELIEGDKVFDQKVGQLINAVVNVRETAPTDKDMVVFVYREISYDYDDPDKKVFCSECFYENEFREKAGKKKNFKVSPDEKGALCPYSYKTETLEAVGNYRVADQSIKECSAVACAAAILYEITWFGYDEKNRMKNIKEIWDTHKKAHKSTAYSSVEEFMKAIGAGTFANCKDKDERRYRELKLRFDKDVEDIKSRWTTKVGEKNHRKRVSLIRAEWKRMYGGGKG